MGQPMHVNRHVHSQGVHPSVNGIPPPGFGAAIPAPLNAPNNSQSYSSPYASKLPPPNGTPSIELDLMSSVYLSTSRLTLRLSQQQRILNKPSSPCLNILFWEAAAELWKGSRNFLIPLSSLSISFVRAFLALSI